MVTQLRSADDCRRHVRTWRVSACSGGVDGGDRSSCAQNLGDECKEVFAARRPVLTVQDTLLPLSEERRRGDVGASVLDSSHRPAPPDRSQGTSDFPKRDKMTT